MKSAEDQLKEARTANGKSFHEIQVKKARITALVLASATIASLIFMVFAFVQKSEADTLRSELDSVRMELKACQSR